MTIFSDDQLAKLVKETIPTLPAGHTNAVIGSVDAEGAQVVVRLSKDTEHGTWEVAGGYRHVWSTGDNQAAARVMLSWK